MNLIKKSKWRMIAGIIIGILIVLGVAGIAFVNQPSFGRLPKGERLEKNQTFAPVQGWGIPKSASHGSGDFGRWALTGYVEVPVFKTGKTLSR